MTAFAHLQSFAISALFPVITLALDEGRYDVRVKKLVERKPVGKR